jgi:hypothetical protein
MNTPKFTDADVINAVSVTLDVMCKARGISLDDLNEAMIDKLLWNSFNEYLGSGRLVADTTCVKRS